MDQRKDPAVLRLAAKLSIAAACIAILGLVAITMFRGPGEGAQDLWWQGDSQIATQVQRVTQAADYPIQLPTWTDGLNPIWAGLLAEQLPAAGVAVWFQEQSTADTGHMRKVHFIQAPGPIPTESWGDQATVEHVTVNGVPAMLEYGSIVDESVQISIPGSSEPFEPKPIPRARLTWAHEGVSFFLDGFEVEPGALVRMAESMRSAMGGQK